MSRTLFLIQEESIIIEGIKESKTKFIKLVNLKGHINSTRDLIEQIFDFHN
jgi:hypothetical protein